MVSVDSAGRPVPHACSPVRRVARCFSMPWPGCVLQDSSQSTAEVQGGSDMLRCQGGGARGVSPSTAQRSGRAAGRAGHRARTRSACVLRQTALPHLWGDAPGLRLAPGAARAEHRGARPRRHCVARFPMIAAADQLETPGRSRGVVQACGWDDGARPLGAVGRLLLLLPVGK